ncbi:hypothetical protein [Maridesulfovibrio ferrireducens]|uniref:hypothetical protein n=1 Tax=Maridesulfovibrio ferrireducens TaxID=246191 RepID=UPI001A2CADC5|nr:hypothetical protein [Maridesulfovibrio ferrireducens]MBI9113142.1 hypothetical protein [Maridesulfovibrio ferrireducens]
MSIIVPFFRGTKPRLSPKHLDISNSQIARNCNLKRGILAPVFNLEGQVPNPIPKAGDIRSIYKLDSGEWLYWANDVDVVKSAASSSDRIMFTGDSYPKQTDQALATSGDISTYPTQTKRLGLPKPDQPLSVQLSPASVADDAELERSTSYVYTYVTEWGEESEPSDPTGNIDVKTGQGCLLSNFRLPTLDGVAVTHFRLYRLNSGDTGAEYQLIPWSDAAADMPASETDYLDELKDSELSSEILQTENWSRPEDDVKGLIHTGNGIFFCFKGKDIFVSESFIPYAYSWKFKLSVPSEIVGLGHFDQTVVVLTKDKAHLIAGIDPSSLSMDKLSFNQSCVAKKSIVNIPGGVLYAAPDGLTLIGPAGVSMLTRPLYTKEQWQTLEPEKLISFYHDGQYFGFFEGTNRGIIYDFELQDIVNIELAGKKVYGGYVDTEDDALYLLTFDDTNYRIERWEGSATPMSYLWKSKDSFYSIAINMGAARIIGTQSALSPLAFRLYADGNLFSTNSITSEEAFRLPSGTLARDWEFEIEGSAEVYEVRVSTSIGDLQNGY